MKTYPRRAVRGRTPVKNITKKARNADGAVTDAALLAETFGIDIDPGVNPAGFIKELLKKMEATRAVWSGEQPMPTEQDQEEVEDETRADLVVASGRRRFTEQDIRDLTWMSERYEREERARQEVDNTLPVAGLESILANASPALRKQAAATTNATAGRRADGSFIREEDNILPTYGCY